MDSIIQSFTSPFGGSIRSLMIDEKPYFVGKDICTALGYSNTNDALLRHCKGVVKRYPLSTKGGTQEIRVITEPDLYRLITHSKLETAQQFEAWVFEEVLPSIRKSGGYIHATPEESSEQIMARALLVAQDTIEKMKAKQLEDRPKTIFADAVADSKCTCLIGELAKLLKQNGINIGQNRLFSWMRENKFLTKKNVPTQYAMERELFHVVERAILKPDGSSILSRTTKVTGKGQQYFINLFLDGKEAA